MSQPLKNSCHSCLLPSLVLEQTGKTNQYLKFVSVVYNRLRRNDEFFQSSRFCPNMHRCRHSQDSIHHNRNTSGWADSRLLDVIWRRAQSPRSSVLIHVRVAHKRGQTGGMALNSTVSAR